jgi:integrase
MPDGGLKNDIQINPFHVQGQSTFSEVMKRISSDTSLPTTRRQNVVSSIRCLLRLLELDPARTPATLPALHPKLRGLHPAQAGISKKRLANIKADVAFAVRHLGLTGTTLRNGKGLAPAWQILWDAIKDDQTRWKVSRLFRFCSALGIEPDAVDDTTIDHLLVALEEESLISNPQATLKTTIYAWNRAAPNTLGWPSQRLRQHGDRREGWTIPLEEFPQSFQNDVKRWLRHLAGDDPLADDAVPCPLRPATLKHRAFQIRMVASALVRRNVPLEQITGLDILVEVNNFRETLRFMIDRQDGTLTEAIYNCATALKAVARHHVKIDPEHLEQLQRICTRIKVKNRGLTEKNRRRLRQFDDSLNVSGLMHLPEQLEALAKRTRGRKAAVIMQLAVAIEILTMAPIRIGNLTALKLGETLFWTRPGRQGRLLLSFPDEDVKNGELIEFDIPTESAKLIVRYLDNYRSLLYDDPGDWLFPGRNGKHKCTGGLGPQVKKTIYRHTGLLVNVHLMRHIGAKIYLDEKPGEIEVMRRVFGHKSIETTTAYYTGFESKAAIKHFDDVILAERRKPVPGKVRITRGKKS